MWIALLLGGCPQKEAREHLEAIEEVCPLAFGLDKEVELPVVAEDPVTLPYPQVSVHLDGETVRFDSWNSMELDDPGFADELSRQWDEGWTDTGVVMVAIAADTPGEQVRDLFVHLAAMEGEPAIYGVAESSIWAPLPEAPHARYYEKAHGLWTVAPLEQRQTLWAMETTKLIRRCLPARQVFEAVAYASPETKCSLMVKGMQIAARRCPGMNERKVATAIHVLVEPDWVPVAWPIELTAEGGQSVRLDQTWGEQFEASRQGPITP